MPNWILKLIKPFIKKRIEALLEDELFKKSIITKVNDKIDLPKLSEQDEAVILGKFYDAVRDSIRMAVELI